MKRVICLYRVSTKGQVDKNDIPMQRIECRAYAAHMPGWKIVDEYSERGVSGYKTSAAKRDKITALKAAAEAKAFDVLLVFMFDRLGRRDDETPFLAQWFIEHGIEIWSTQEGQMKLENHTDKLLNYIRFWQASGESEKTSLRVRTRQQQMTEAGIWRGGPIPFGYVGVHNGRMGKRNRMLYDLQIDPEASVIVKEIFHLYCNKGYGLHRIAEYMNEHYPRPEKIWVPTTISNMLHNELYIGVYRCGSVRSPVQEHLRIIDDELFAFAQDAMKRRVTRHCTAVPENEEPTKMDRYGATLLSGLLYCAHCGHRLVGSYTNQNNKVGPPRYRQIYRCYYGATKARKCDGQATYSARRIEQAVLSLVERYIQRIQDAIQQALEQSRAATVKAEIQALRSENQNEIRALQLKRNRLKEEIVNSVMGTSEYDPGTLKEALQSIETQIAALSEEIETAIHRSDLTAQQETAIRQITPLVQSWEKVFRICTNDEKKMILARLIDRITVDKTYQITIFFRISLAEFTGNPADSALISTS